MERLYDIGKLDPILSSQSVASTTVTGEYHSVANYRTIAIIVSTGVMATGNTVTLQLTQAKDHDGLDVKNITGVVGAINANTGVEGCTITLSGTTAGETVVINGLTFTAHATTTTVSNREFSIAGSDTTDATNLVTCLTDPDYGLIDINVDRTANVITLEPVDESGVTLTVVGDTNITVATILASGYCEISTDLLDGINGFTHVGISVTTNATIVIGGFCARLRARYTPKHNYAATYLEV